MSTSPVKQGLLNKKIKIIHRVSILMTLIFFLTGCSTVSIKGDNPKPGQKPFYKAPSSTTNSASAPQTTSHTSKLGPRIDLFDEVPSQDNKASLSATPTNMMDHSRVTLMEPGSQVPGGDLALSGLAFGDLWDRVRAGFRMDLTINNRRVAKHRNWYAKHGDYLLKVLERARPYLFQVVTELEANQIPLEIALLPVIESAYDPFAYSRSGASGLWQFIPSTGASLGLKQNWWYDGRRDIEASTKAAVTYLTRLNKMFDGDWELTLAAYNGGNGTVRRAIEKNARRGKPTDFWSLDLSDETENYVPKMIAIAQIVQNPAQFGINPLPIANTPHFTIVQTPGQIDLAQASQLSGVSLEEIYRLNPGFNRWASDPEGPHRLALPVSKAELFLASQANLSQGPSVTWKRYLVQKGDTLVGLAQRFNTTTSQISQVNHLRSHTIKIGQQLLIPEAAMAMSDYTMSADNRLEELQNRPRPNAVKKTYKVMPGDTLWSVANKFGVSVYELSKANGISHRDPLAVDQTLVVWQDQQMAQDPISTDEIEDAFTQLSKVTEQPNTLAKPQNATRKILYRVRDGDSLYRIADRFNLEVDDIKSWNTLEKDIIHPGQKLTLYIDVTNQSQ